MADQPLSGALEQTSPVRGVSAEEVARRIKTAREAQVQWRRYSLSQRIHALRGLWAHIRERREELVGVIHAETGKPFAEIGAMEIDGVELILKFFTRSLHRVLQDQPAPRPWTFLNKRGYIRYVPRGVIGLITPWNMPFLIPLGDSIPALLAGNAVILKPSEWTTKIAVFLEDCFRSTGLFPEGLFQVVPGEGETGAAVIEGVDMVVFTGSTATGRKVAVAAAARLIPSVLELGGLHPMLVAADAPLRRASKAAVWGRFANCGQICVGVERVYVVKSVYREFCELVEKEVAALRLGPAPGKEDGAKADEYDVDMGRLIYPGQLAVVEAHLADAKEKGGRIVGAEVLDRGRLIVSPGVVFDATAEMKIMQEETFGPVLAVMPVARIDDAIRAANKGPHGLAASVWTRDIPQGEEWCSLLEAGLVSVNDVLSHYVVCSLPFGGVKQSGLGRRHSDDGLRMFTEPQSVIVHEWPADSPDLWWFPYSRFKSKLLAWLIRWT